MTALQTLGSQHQTRIANFSKHAIRATLTVALVIVQYIAAAPLHADGRADDHPVIYRDLIEEALRQYNAQHYLRARALLLEAHRMWPNARTLRGLGRVSFELGHYREAIDYLEQAETATAQPLDADLLRETMSLKRRARETLAHLTIELSPRGATVLIDGVPYPVGPDTVLALDPGTHPLEISAPGYRAELDSITLKPGERTHWRIRLVRVSSGPGSQAIGTEVQKESTPTLAPAPPPPPRGRTSLAAPSPRTVGGPPGWLVPAGLSLVAAGALGTGLAGATYGSYLRSGSQLRRVEASHAASALADFQDTRTQTLVLSTLGLGVLSLGAAALAPSIPKPTRRWLTPTLLAVGGALLATGLVILAANPNHCGDAISGDFSCTPNLERGDSGALLAMISAPVLSIPLVYAMEWLTE